MRDLIYMYLSEYYPKLFGENEKIFGPGVVIFYVLISHTHTHKIYVYSLVLIAARYICCIELQAHSDMNCSALKQSAGSIRWLSYYAKSATWWDFPFEKARKYQVNCYEKKTIASKKSYWSYCSLQKSIWRITTRECKLKDKEELI